MFARSLLVSLSFLALISGAVLTLNGKTIANALAVVSCAAAHPCIGGDNTGSGPGVEGTNNTLEGAGVKGLSSAGIGLYGKTSKGAALRGEAIKTGYGAYVTSLNGVGLEAFSQNGYAVYAYANGSKPAVHVSGGKGNALEVAASGGTAAALVTNASGNAVDATGSYIGVVGRAPGTGYPLVATDSPGNNVFYVTGTGDVYYHGALHPFLRTASGKMATAFGTQSATPVIQDVGSGTLTNGVAFVPLNGAFADAIDRRTPYHVLLTPNGETRGLFVARKDARGFVVRELQGGRGTLTFDYQVSATALGRSGEGMREASSVAQPHAQPRGPR